MPAEFRRKLYARGSSFEVTIPKPLLFALDLRGKKYDVLFSYLAETRRWQFRFGERASRKAHTPAEFRRKLYRRSSSGWTPGRRATMSFSPTLLLQMAGR